MVLVDGSEERLLNDLIASGAQLEKLFRRVSTPATIPRQQWRPALTERFARVGHPITPPPLERLLAFGGEEPYRTMLTCQCVALAAERGEAGTEFDVQQAVAAAARQLAMADQLPLAFELTGQVAKYRELLDLLAERPRLTLLAAAPRSGTSSLLAHAADATADPVLLVDARRCRDARDLAMAIADVVVARFAGDARSAGGNPADDRSTGPELRLSRALSVEVIDLEPLQHGSGLPGERLMEALLLTRRLADGRFPTVVVDHLGELLAGQTENDSRKLLADLRAAAQTHAGNGIVLVDNWGGPVERALNDPEHPFYQAGGTLHITRPTPEQYASDLAVTKGLAPGDVTVPLIRGCADLATGVPALVWRMLALSETGLDPPATVSRAWQQLVHITEPEMPAQWALLRRAHPHAHTVAAALASGVPPNTAAPNAKAAYDALARLRGSAWPGNRNRAGGLSPIRSSHAGPATTRRPGWPAGSLARQPQLDNPSIP